MNAPTEDDITFTLTRDEYTALLIMMGYATGAAHRDGDRSLAYSFLSLANAVNRNNPDWVPYDTRQEENREENDADRT